MSNEIEALASSAIDKPKADTVQHIKTIAVEALDPGDRIRMSATHQVQIDGMDSWIKVEVDSSVRESESPKEAISRVGRVIAGNIVNEIERQAEVIGRANAAQTTLTRY